MPNLLDLPAEVRLLIYNYALPNGTTLQIAADSDSHLKNEMRHPGIRFASKQMYDETAPILFGRNVVELCADTCYESFSRTMKQLAAMTRPPMLWMPEFDFLIQVLCPPRTVCPCRWTVAVCIRFDLKERRFRGAPRYAAGTFRHEENCVVQGQFFHGDFADRIFRAYDLLWESLKSGHPLAERQDVVRLRLTG